MPEEFFAEIAGKDATLAFDMVNGIVWEVNGADISENTTLADRDLAVDVARKIFLSM